MTVVRKSALVPYSAAEMYTLVDGIESYPQFLPWCRSSTVHHRTPEEARATLEMARGGIQKSFTTLNRMQADKIIEVRLVEGPFRQLNGFWRFDQLGERACKVSLDMDFEFSSRMLELMIGPVFSQIANTLVDAFHKRAVEVYGKR